jgi:hypothetical protein
MTEIDIKTSEEKKDLTLDMVMRVVKLSKLQIRNLFTTTLRQPVPGGEDVVSPDNLFYILLADLLERLDFLKAEQRLLILEGVWAQKNANTAGEESCCLDHLAFADGQHCTWTGQTGWLDLESGETTALLACAPLESIAYNLNELYRRGVLQIEQRAGFHAKKFDAGSLDEPGDVRERTPDAVP